MIRLERCINGYYLKVVERILASDGSGRREEKIQRIPWDGAQATVGIRFTTEEQSDFSSYFYYKGTEKVACGNGHSLHFCLEHFTGCRIGLASMATEKVGGHVRFSNFQIL